MQILNKNRLVVSNMTEIRWIFTQQFESLKMDFLFDGFFRSLSYKNTEEELSSITLNSEAKLKSILTLRLQ